MPVSNTPSQTPSNTVSATPSNTVSMTVSATPSNTVSATPSNTVSRTPSNTVSMTVSATPSNTVSRTPSNTVSQTVSATPSNTVSATPSNTVSATPSRTSSQTPSNTVSATASQTISNTRSQTPSNTISGTPSNTKSQTPSRTVSATPSNTVSNTKSATPSNTETAAFDPREMTGEFSAKGSSDVMFLQPGEACQYKLYLSTGNFVGTIRLEQCVKGDKWETVMGPDSSLVKAVGTTVSPKTSTIYSALVKNETGRSATYRWYCADFGGASTGRVSWSLINAVQASYWIDRLSNVCMISFDRAPTNGSLGEGAGYAGGGSIYIANQASGDPKIYFNNGTAAAPDWDAM